jgi:hypothetical protein
MTDILSSGIPGWRVAHYTHAADDPDLVAGDVVREADTTNYGVSPTSPQLDGRSYLWLGSTSDRNGFVIKGVSAIRNGGRKSDLYLLVQYIPRDLIGSSPLPA